MSCWLAAGQTERKISFVLHEPDNGSEGSSKSTVTMQGEDGVEEKKRRLAGPGPGPAQSCGTTATPAAAPSSSSSTSRPHLLRRGTTANATSGSFKRRSLKLRRHTKEAKEILEYDCEYDAVH